MARRAASRLAAETASSATVELVLDDSEGVLGLGPEVSITLGAACGVLDYATLGIPVIAARLRTVEHYFGHGAAELFEPGSVVDLTRAIRRVHEDPDLRVRLVEHARQALDAMNWQKQRNEYYRAIDSLLTA